MTKKSKKKPFLGSLSLALSHSLFHLSLVISISQCTPPHVHGTSTASVAATVASTGFESASEGSTAGSLETSLRARRQHVVGKSAKRCKK